MTSLGSWASQLVLRTMVYYIMNRWNMGSSWNIQESMSQCLTWWRVESNLYSRETTKESCIFWKKNWNHIAMKFYIEHTIPVLDDWLKQHSRLQFIQDDASDHREEETQTEIKQCNMSMISWSSYLPDLNPIETIWDKMKNYLQNNFSEQMIYSQLRAAVQEAWDSITVDQLNELINDMHDCCHHWETDDEYIWNCQL